MKKTIRASEFGSEGPIGSLLALLGELPEVSNELMRMFGEAVVEAAKQNIEEGGTDEGMFVPLWVSSEGPGPYQWTPEFNKKSRVSSRDDDKPLVDTGELKDSIGILGQTRNGKSGSIISVGIVGDDTAQMKAWKHEYGGDNPLNHGDMPLGPIPARPFLGPAIEQVENDSEIADMMQSFVDSALESAAKKAAKQKGKGRKGKRKKRK